MPKMSVLVLSLVGAMALSGHAGAMVEAVAPDEAAAEVEVEIAEFGPVRVAFTEHTGSFEQMAKAIPVLYAELGKQGVMPGGAPMGIYYNDPQTVAEEVHGKQKYDHDDGREKQAPGVEVHPIYAVTDQGTPGGEGSLDA